MEYYPNLYNEIFLGNEYLFTAKNDNPMSLTAAVISARFAISSGPTR